MQQTMNQQTPYELVMSAIAACDAFCEHLDFENKALEARDIETVEEGTKTKRHLGAKLEGILKDVKEQRNFIKQDAQAVQELQNLQTAIDLYQNKARKNVMLLSAAHEATAQFLNMVRQAVSKLKPKTKTYGQTGQIEERSSSKSSLINKEI